MSAIIPPSRPMQKRADTARELSGFAVTEKVALLGVRGYYRDTMGVPGKNDRGIYDDAIFLYSPEAHVAFNANTDPSVTRKHIAVLRQGLWYYKVGIHGLSKPKAQQYTALVQAGEVTVIRDDEGSDKGYFGINIHRGSYGSTSSLGCQTIFPDQWPAFIALVQSEMKRAGQKTIPYLLVENS
jgi:lysozyme